MASNSQSVQLEIAQQQEEQVQSTLIFGGNGTVVISNINIEDGDCDVDHGTCSITVQGLHAGGFNFFDRMLNTNKVVIESGCNVVAPPAILWAFGWSTKPLSVQQGATLTISGNGTNVVRQGPFETSGLKS